MTLVYEYELKLLKR